VTPTALAPNASCAACDDGAVDAAAESNDDTVHRAQQVEQVNRVSFRECSCCHDKIELAGITSRDARLRFARDVSRETASGYHHPFQGKMPMRSSLGRSTPPPAIPAPGCGHRTDHHAIGGSAREADSCVTKIIVQAIGARKPSSTLRTRSSIRDRAHWYLSHRSRRGLHCQGAGDRDALLLAAG